MITALLAATALPIPPGLFERPVPPEVLNPTEVITSDDYPIEAIWERQEGRTRIELRIDQRGRVSDCVIAQTSGSALLDQRSCELFRERARFRPARDSAGKRVEGALRRNLNWTLPKLPKLPLANWTSRMSWQIGRDGKSLACRVDQPIPVDQYDDCKLAMRMPVEFRRRMRQGATRDVALVFVERRFHIGEPPTPLTVGRGPGETLLAREVVRFAIDQSGKVTDCKVLEFAGRSNPAGNPCNRFDNWFLPPAGSGGGASGSIASYVFTVFRRD